MCSVEMRKSNCPTLLFFIKEGFYVPAWQRRLISLIFSANPCAWRKRRFFLESLEFEHCSYDVPVQNRLHHLRGLPSKDEIDQLFQESSSLPLVKIYRNAVDRSCKNILESDDLQQWMALLKTLYIDKKQAETTGEKFAESEKRYFHIVCDRLSIIFVLDNGTTLEQQLFSLFETAIHKSSRASKKTWQWPLQKVIIHVFI